MKKLPIGIQSFEKLRSEGFLYVDKTKEIYRSEKPTNRGRMDAVLLQSEWAIVVELKYHATTKLNTLLNQAIAQIREKRYYEQFLDRKVILLGIAFRGKEVSCRIEPLSEP